MRFIYEYYVKYENDWSWEGSKNIIKAIDQLFYKKKYENQRELPIKNMIIEWFVLMKNSSIYTIGSLLLLMTFFVIDMKQKCTTIKNYFIFIFDFVIITTNEKNKKKFLKT